MSQDTAENQHDSSALSVYRREPEYEMPHKQEAEESPLRLVMNGIHGRWRPAIIMGLVLSPLAAWAGYTFAPVTFTSTSVLVVESSLAPLVEETIETAGIVEFDAFVIEKAQQVKDPQVLFSAIDAPEIREQFEVSRPNYREAIFEGLRVENPKRSPLVIVSFEDWDPVFAAAAVNAVVASYRKIYAPDPATVYRDKVITIDNLINQSRARLNQLKLSRNQVALDAKYGRADVAASIIENVKQIRAVSLERENVENRLSLLREQYALRVRIEAEDRGEEATEADLEPSAGTMLEPAAEDLLTVDPLIRSIEEELANVRVAFEITSRRFGTRHTRYRREKMDYESKLAAYEGRLEAAKVEWKKIYGKRASFGALQLKIDSLQSEIEGLANTNMDLERQRIEVEELDGRILQENNELAKLDERRINLERERDTIREGRVRFPRSEAVPAFVPTKNKKFPAAIAGFVGGWFISLGFFTLVGNIDRKTFGVCQLKTSADGTRVLGVLPNMDELGNTDGNPMLASDCVHRIRGRIESRRSPESGYSIMVSSPFQGDGKTTLAVSLGWSYAESGYKTLLLDADFVGRAMSHQFGRLKDPGLREIIRNGAVGDEVSELGHPNLSLLGVGFDRRISASNLSPRLVSRVLDQFRESYDIIIVDSGPITASIEAIPVASAVDGVILTLRRGRSRARLTECRDDVLSVGADYLGVVLNYAERSDCERYGSTSKMSTTIQAVLELDDGASPPAFENPVIEGLVRRDKEQE
ncbi:AAA family ATPase [bacterium]|nr:AAA family ATPase [bacterium]